MILNNKSAKKTNAATDKIHLANVVEQ